MKSLQTTIPIQDDNILRYRREQKEVVMVRGEPRIMREKVTTLEVNAGPLAPALRRFGAAIKRPTMAKVGAVAVWVAVKVIAEDIVGLFWKPTPRPKSLLRLQFQGGSYKI